MFPLARRLAVAAVSLVVPIGAGAAAKPAEAGACADLSVCLYDDYGWKGTPKVFACNPQVIRNYPIGPLAGRVSSAINRCRRQVVLSDFDRIHPPGLAVRSTTLLAGQWAWTLGGVRGMDNRARSITVR